MDAKNSIRWHGFGVKLSGNILAKFELKQLKTRRKKGKIDLGMFFQSNKIKTLRC